MSNFEYSPYDYAGVATIGDGLTDAYSCWMRAITAAESNGGTVIGDPGNFKLSAPLVVSDRLRLRGCGYNGDQGAAYAARVAPTAAYKGCNFLPGNFPALEVITNAAVILEGFQVSYLTNPTAGTTGVFLTSAIGASQSVGVNTDSVLRDVFVVGADTGVLVTDWYDFVIENLRVQNAQSTSIQLSPTIWPSYGDSSISKSKFFSGSVQQHLLINSGGGLRVSDTKFNFTAGVGGACSVRVSPNLNTTAEIEPLMFDNCSAEGGNYGYVFQRTTGNTVVSGVSIKGGNIYVGGPSSIGVVIFAAAGNQKWVEGMIIDSMIMLSDGGTGIALNCCDSVHCGNSVFTTSSGTASAVQTGVTVTNVNTSGILRSPGVA